MSVKYETTPEDARKIHEWLLHRGGLAHWDSQDLGTPGRSWTTPLLDAEGNPTKRPHWSTPSQPSRVTTEVSDVEVVTPIEVRRFRVSLKQDGFRIVCTDASSEKVRKAEARAREHAADKQAWHEFDYATQEAVIYVNGPRRPLAEFAAKANT